MTANTKPKPPAYRLDECTRCNHKRHEHYMWRHECYAPAYKGTMYPRCDCKRFRERE